jgi:3-oxoacyl-[acyl-carrier protein] reductase
MWQEMLAINATSAFLCSRAAAPRLRASGGGAIVGVASAAALSARPGMAPYVAAKAAVVALTRALAAELGPDRITVNAVAPATIAGAEQRAAAPPAQRAGWVTPTELAATILWLLGPEARQVNGTVIDFGR